MKKRQSNDFGFFLLFFDIVSNFLNFLLIGEKNNL